MKITICDDDIKSVEILEKYCADYIEKRNLEVEIEGLTTTIDIMKSTADVMILDIDMPEKNGIEIKNLFANQPEGPWILFATSHSEQMVEAFGRKVIGFLTKPVEQEALELLLEATFKQLSLEKKIQLEGGRVINSNRIIHIKADKYYTEILTTTGEQISYIRKTLKAWEEELNQCGFIRITDGYLVNCRYIKAFQGTSVILKDEKDTLTVSRGRKNQCIEEFKAYCKKMAKLA